MRAKVREKEQPETFSSSSMRLLHRRHAIRRPLTEHLCREEACPILGVNKQPIPPPLHKAGVARQRVGPISLGIAPSTCTILIKLLFLRILLSRCPTPIYGLRPFPLVGVTAAQRGIKIHDITTSPSRVQRDMGWGSTPSLFLARLAADPWGSPACLIPRLCRARTPQTE